VLKPCRELLNPEQTSNPVLQRFYYAVGQRAVYGREGYSISPGDTDDVVAGTVDPPLDYMAAKAAALREGLADAFPITVSGQGLYSSTSLKLLQTKATNSCPACKPALNSVTPTPPADACYALTPLMRVASQHCTICDVTCACICV
jgi:hypothetical protein